MLLALAARARAAWVSCSWEGPTVFPVVVVVVGATVFDAAAPGCWGEESFVVAGAVSVDVTPPAAAFADATLAFTLPTPGRIAPSTAAGALLGSLNRAAMLATLPEVGFLANGSILGLMTIVAGAVCGGSCPPEPEPEPEAEDVEMLVGCNFARSSRARSTAAETRSCLACSLLLASSPPPAPVTLRSSVRLGMRNSIRSASCWLSVVETTLLR